MNSITHRALKEKLSATQEVCEAEKLSALTLKGFDFMTTAGVSHFNKTKILSYLRRDYEGEISSQMWLALFLRSIELKDSKKALRILPMVDDLNLLKFAKLHYLEVALVEPEIGQALQKTINRLQRDVNSDLYNGVVFGKINYVKEAIASGANVNVTNGDQSALSWAVSVGHLDIVRYLIESGADVNQRNKDNTTPVHDCFEQKNTKYHMLEALLSLASEHQLSVYKAQINEKEKIASDVRVWQIFEVFEEKFLLLRQVSAVAPAKLHILNVSSANECGSIENEDNTANLTYLDEPASIERTAYAPKNTSKI